MGGYHGWTESREWFNLATWLQDQYVINGAINYWNKALFKGSAELATDIPLNHNKVFNYTACK